MRDRILRLLALCSLPVLFACSATSSDDGAVDDTFQALSDDEVIDPNDPPTNPDPKDAPGAVETQGTSKAPSCPRYTELSPTGLTFVIDIVDAAQLDDLMKVERFIRVRDVFVVRPTSGPVAALRKQFPCNRIMALAYPSELSHLDAMKNEGLDAVVLDWEGANQAESLNAQEKQLANIKREIVNRGMQTAMAPGTNWVKTAAAAKYEYVLAQTQPSCKAAVSHFGFQAHAMASDAKGSLGIRNAAAEISLDSSETNAVNHVDAERAADCARAGYGHGARAIYVFGQQAPHLADFFGALHKRGLRSPR